MWPFISVHRQENALYYQIIPGLSYAIARLRSHMHNNKIDILTQQNLMNLAYAENCGRAPYNFRR